jgi:hypothetical protein
MSPSRLIAVLSAVFIGARLAPIMLRSLSAKIVGPAEPAGAIDDPDWL